MISEAKIIEAIDAANSKFIWCWERFQKFKRFEMEREELFEFQVKLAKGISHLDHTYRRIKAEQERLIGRKTSYTPAWFARRIAKLDLYLKAIKEAIGIGRGIGDGFAWIFYQAERELLDEHAKEQRQLLLPPAVGGIGELAFIAKMQGLGGTFILYHAITSYLRLGDFSFFNPETGEVSAIGELKTRHEAGDTYTVTLGYVTGDSKSFVLEGAEHATANDSNYKPLDKPTQQKLDRQMSQLSKAIGKRVKSNDNLPVVFQGKFHFDTLDRLLRECGEKRFEMGQAGPGLVLGAWRLRHKDSLGKRFLKMGGNLDAAVQPVKDSVSVTLNSDFADNSLFIGSLASPESGFPVLVKGGIPMLWWPLGEQQMHDLLFGHVMVMSFFNPAQLWHILRSRGYDVVVNDRYRAVKLIKQIGNRRIEVENFSYFEQLTPYALMDEHAVAGMIDAWVAQAIAAAGDRPTKIVMRPRFMEGA
ncbi:hypothetical protein EN833_15125 [Mesorhizobium sp. M4B.F.Ca.ET.190.01.1.1]|nr:hypothetical protein EN833_15125 [Mesorhizobium sp. M4B.F.Ca.ET.190.01.1.1]